MIWLWITLGVIAVPALWAWAFLHKLHNADMTGTWPGGRND